MNKELRDSLTDVLYNWKQIQFNDFETAERDANRLSEAFELFVEEIKSWIQTLDTKPDVDEVRTLPEILEIKQLMPEPLYVNFEFELDSFLEDMIISNPASYFG